MHKRTRLIAVLGLVTVFLAAVLTATPQSEASVLTSNYSYVINGKEVAVGVDPLSLKTGLLLPAAVLDQLGVRFVERADSSILLSRGEVTVILKLGSTIAVRGEEKLMLPSTPVRLTGQIYIPTEALSLLGFKVTAESNLLLVESWVASKEIPMTAEEYVRLKASATTERSVNPGKNATVRFEATHLKRDLVMASPWTKDPFVRGRVKELLDEGLLLFQVSITNVSSELFSFPASNYYLVDNLGNQYSPSNQWISLTGDFVGLIAPSAKASGVLVFPVPHPDARSVRLLLQTGAPVDELAFYQLPAK